jgi:phosphoribosylanthranilate isomerase
VLKADCLKQSVKKLFKAMKFRVKICGITKPDQGREIVALGATDLGFICVPGTPRYISPDHIRAITETLHQETPSDETPRSIPKDTASANCVGVFLNATIKEIYQTVERAHLHSVQLHGTESIQFCNELRIALPHIEIIKALRIRSVADLNQASVYELWVDAVLLDAYHPEQAGGTGTTIDWTTLNQFRPHCPWLLAGGLNPDNILDALNLVSPNGIDLSSGVEHAPGDKNLEHVQRLFENLKDSKLIQLPESRLVTN